MIEDCVYELDEAKRILPQMKIFSSRETIELLRKEPRSFARFGDGEIEVMKGGSAVFQDYDPLLAEKLKEVLSCPREDLYVGLNAAYFSSPFGFAERNRRFYRLHGQEYRRFFLSSCDLEARYLDAGCFTAYYRYNDCFDYRKHYESVKGLFDGRRIVLVAGEGVLEKLQYNIFSDAIVKKRISAPSKNAFSEYQDIIKRVSDVASADDLVCLVLGVAATVLAADLSKLGYVAWDIGHVAKDYDAYMRNMAKTEANMNDFWAAD